MIFFAGFYWLWDFLSFLYARNNIFRKRNYKYEILNPLYFRRSFVFWRTALGRFSQCFFSNFSSLVNHGGQHFYSALPPPPPPSDHKKASYGPERWCKSKKSLSCHCKIYVCCTQRLWYQRQSKLQNFHRVSHSKKLCTSHYARTW